MTREVEEEAAKLRRVPGIVFADGPAGRRARVGGTGIEVFEVIATYRDVGGDWQLLKQSYDWLTEDQLRAALAYYAAFPAEIDDCLREYESESLEAFWQAYPSTRPPWR